MSPDSSTQRKTSNDYGNKEVNTIPAFYWKNMHVLSRNAPVDNMIDYQGAQALGAIKGSLLRDYCRSNIDTLVIMKPQNSISEGPTVVDIDGSHFL